MAAGAPVANVRVPRLRAAGAATGPAACADHARPHPYAYDERARGRLQAGDPAGALASARQATKVSPNHADGPELAGEALLAAGKPGDAAREFSRAAKAYPWWGLVQLKWGEALARSGKAEAAKAKFALAGRLDLTRAERAELARVNR